MDTEGLAARARSYIAALELPPAPRSKGAEAAPDLAVTGALAVGQNLVEFAPGADPNLRATVTDALLLAQLAADNAKALTPDQWYEAYRGVLIQLGFRSEGLTRSAQDFAANNAELHEAILPVITAAFGGAAIPALVIETLRQLKAASEDRPWITLFERESRRFDARQAVRRLVVRQRHRRQMASRRVAGDDHPLAVVAQRIALSVEPGEATADLADDRIHVDRRGEIVADQRHRGAGRERLLCDEGEGLGIETLPIAAVNEHQKRRPGRRRQEPVDDLARAVAIGEIEAAGIALAKLAAVGFVAIEVALMLGHGRAQIVIGVQRRPVRLAFRHASFS
jgi:hypothetical protein